MRAPAALSVIESLMLGADKDSVRLAAAAFIIERGYGKAVQRNEHAGPGGDLIQHSLEVVYK
jgi:hypothetical protein